MPAFAIATPHADATRAGTAVLAEGGSAADAALAAAAVLTVAYPHNCALGGDLFALVRTPDGRTVSVNASGPAAAAADPAGLGDRMPLRGPATVTVPGLVAGWGAIHDLAATRPWRRHLEAAIGFATDGVPVARRLAEAIAGSHGVAHDPGLRSVFGGLREGDVLRQPALARTLETLADEGASALYRGAPADRFAAGLNALGCALTAADLAAFTPAVEAPLRGRYRDLDVLSSAPNSSGVLLLQALAALDRTGVEDPLGAGAARLARIFRGGNAQRAAELADHGFDRDRWLGDARLAELVEDPPAPTPAAPRPTGDTIAIVALDADGGAVSLIQSLFSFFGAQLLEPSTGIIVQNRGTSFSLEPGHPNRLAPGRRPAHTLMPVLAEREGALVGVLGTMGGTLQAQIHAQVLLRLLAGTPAQAAVDAPRWAIGSVGADGGEGVLIDDGVPERAVTALSELGLPVVRAPRGSEATGHAQAIWRDPELTVGSDSRADGRP